MGKVVVKGAGGKRVMPTKVKQAKAKATLDAETAKAAQQAKDKLREKRALKSSEANTATGFSNLGSVNAEADLQWLSEWFKVPERVPMLAFTVSLARNGFVEKAYKDQQGQVSADNQGLGRKVFTRLGLRFRALGGRESLVFIRALTGNPQVSQWFAGDDKLPIEVAAKCLRWMLGVSESTPVPRGHAHAQYEVPLVWLFNIR